MNEDQIKEQIGGDLQYSRCKTSNNINDINNPNKMPSSMMQGSMMFDI
jgi:hypothetical protein